MVGPHGQALLSSGSLKRPMAAGGSAVKRRSHHWTSPHRRRHRTRWPPVASITASVAADVTSRLPALRSAFSPAVVARSILVLSCSVLLVLHAPASSAQSPPNLPNPCPSPYHPVPSMVFPEYYASSYLSTATIPAGLSSPFNTTTFTIQFWLSNARTGSIYAATLVQLGNPALSASAPAGSHINITWTSGDSVAFDTGHGDICTTAAVFTTLLNDWNLWSFTYRRSNGTTTKSIYMNGFQQCVTSNSLPALAIMQSTPLVLGNQFINFSLSPGWSTTYYTPTNLNNAFAGYMADFRVYGRVLSQAEMTLTATTGIHINNSELLLWYNFAEQNGTTAMDRGSAQLNVTMNNITAWMQQQPVWSGYYLQPLCLWTPTTLTPAGPPSSPNCQGMSTAFTVTVSVLDSGGYVVTAVVNASVSLAVSAASSSPAFVSVSPASATITAGVASFTVSSSVAQSITLTAVDSGLLLLTPQSTVIAVSAPTGVNIVSGVYSALPGVNQTVSVFASACGGRVLVTGPSATGLSTSLGWLQSASAGINSASLSLSSAGTANVSVGSASAAAYTFFLVDTSGSSLTMGSNQSVYWTASIVSAVAIQPVIAANGTQPSASSFYAGTVLSIPVWAVDWLGGPMSDVSCSVTLTVSNATGSFSQLVSITAGVGTATMVASAAGSAVLSLTDTAGTGYPMAPALSVTVTGGQAVAFVFSPINVTNINVAVSSSTSLLVQAVDASGNVASSYTGAVSVLSSSVNTLIDGLPAPQVVSLSSGQAVVLYMEDTTSSTPAPVVLSFSDTASTGLNVSSQQVIYVQPASGVCPSGQAGSGAVSFNNNSGGQYQNTADLINFGVSDFAMSVWAYVVVDGPNYFASQSYFPPAYSLTDSIINTLFVGPEQQPEALGMTFDMAFLSDGTSSWSEYNMLSVAQFPMVGVWSHWVFNYYAATSNQTIWCNGSLVGQRMAMPWSTLGALQGSWQLGMAPITYGRGMASTAADVPLDNRPSPYSTILMDDLRAYSRHLADYEVVQMARYNTYSNPAGLLLHYSFDEGIGSVMHDSVGHFDVPTWNATGGASPTWVSYLPNCLSTARQVVILPPAAARLGTVMAVSLQAQDAFGNPSAGFAGRAQVVVSNSWGNTSASVPVSGIVQLSQGTGVVNLTDTVPETLTLSLLDLDQTGLTMTSTATAQFYSGPLAQLFFTSYPSQRAGGSSGSLVVVSCQDQWGNLELTSCIGTVTLLHNSSHSLPASGIVLTLSNSTGSAAVVLYDSAVETVQLSLSNTGGLSAATNSTAVFYSTGAPAALVTGNYSLTRGAVGATVDAAVLVSVRVVDSYGTLCNYVSAAFTAAVSSTSGNATGGGSYTINAGVAVVPVADRSSDNVTLSFSNSSLTLPPSLALTFESGVTTSIVFSGVSWPTQPGLLYTNATATLTIAAVDQYGNPTSGFTGSVTVDAYDSLTSEFNMAAMVRNSTLRSVTVTLINGSASVKVNDSVAETATFALSNCSVAGLSLGANQLLSFASTADTACRYYTVYSAFGSAYYDFPVKSTGSGAFSAWPAGTFIPLNTSQTVKVTVHCVPTADSTAADTTVNGIQLTLNFSHNQTALINGPCTMKAGVCYLYFQSFAAGNMSVSVVDYGPHYFIWPAPYYVLFAQDTPIIWSVSGQSGTTDGSTLVPQLVTMTGQTFMCGQNFSQPPLVQLQDSVTGLVANCPVTAFNATYLSCLLPAGQGKPAIVLTVCGNITQFNLPRWPTDAYFFATGSTTDNCLSMDNVWDFGSHTWSDNGLCTKVGRSLIDYRWYQPAYNNTAYGASPLPAEYANNSYQSVPAEVLTTHRCTSIQELNEPWGWPSMYLCMPNQAPYSWTLSRTGIPEGDSCLPIREGSDPYWSDGSHYMCTLPDTPYPDVDGIQLYYYQAPYIASITPATANCSGNTTITLTGSSFGLNGTGVNTVTVGGSPCVIDNVVYNNSYMECLLPAGATLFNAVVMTVEGVVASNTPNFPYLPPVITAISPSAGLTSGGQNVTIEGYNFGFTTATATIGGAACATLMTNNTALLCSTPAGTGGSLAVYVTSSYQSNLLPFLWSYQPPAVTSVTPAQYDCAGMVPLTVYGSSFGASGATTLVGDQLCEPLTQSHTVIVCVLPAGQGANVSVTVSTAGLSSSNSGLFSYAAPNITQPPSPLGAASGTDTYLTLSGTSFGQSGTVLVGGSVCDATDGVWENALVICAAPLGSGSVVAVQMQVAGQLSNIVYFTYSPVITGVNAARAFTAGGRPMVLYGQGFSSTAIVNDSVLVNGWLSCPVLSQNVSVIVCAVPPGQGTANTVQVVGQFSLLSAPFPFAYAAPVITGQSPPLAPAAGGVNITLAGSSFGFGNLTTVTVNSVQCAVLTANHTSVTFIAPSGFGQHGLLLVIVAGQSSGAWPFSYSPPLITAIAPVSGSSQGGYFLILTGANFGSAGVTPVVSMGAAVVVVNTHNASFINVTVRAGQSTVSVSVIVGSQLSNIVSFSYLPPSLITVSPSVGPTSGNGTLLTLTGDSFGTDGSATVYLTSAAGSTVCPITSCSPQTILCLLPAGQGANLTVVVLSGGQTSNALMFSYSAPMIAAVGPSSAPTDGGAIITLTGSSFGQGVIGCSVMVGGSLCLPTGPGTLYTDSSIQCALPAGQGYGFSTSVTVSGQSFSLADSFSYAAPSISSLVPATGPTIGGFSLTVLGSSFGSTANVSFVAPLGSAGALPCAQRGFGQSNEQIACTAPAYQGTAVAVYVTVGGQVSAAALFAFNPPVVLSISPLLADTAGTTLITLSGSDFGIGSDFTVAVDDTVVTPSLFNSSMIIFTMPSGTGIAVPLSLVVAGQAATYSGPLLAYVAPSIVNVTGCTQSGAVTAWCPTAGGVDITVHGANLGNDPSVLAITIGGLPCDDAAIVLADTAVSCQLSPQPLGGYDVAVTVTVAGQSASSPYLSYAGPIILSNTLVVAGSSAASSGSLTVADPLETATSVSFQGLYWTTSAADISVTYGVQGAAKIYSCSTPAVWLVNASSAPFVYGVNCSVAVGVGSGLVFVVQVGSLTSLEGSDTLSYPTPLLLSDTLRLSEAALGSTVVIGVLNPGDTLYFNASHVGVEASLLSVSFGTLVGSTYTVAGQCGNVGLQVADGQPNTVSCVMPQGEPGIPYILQLTALNAQTVPSSSQDVYEFSIRPSVSSVHGCTDVGNVTTMCPTTGGVYLSVSGQFFSDVASSMSVQVGSGLCDSIIAVSSTELYCQLEAGAGLNSSVTVSVADGSLLSVPVASVSYAPAVVLQVSGCDDALYGTTNCPREGGTIVTVRGQNFGPGLPLVLLGDLQCLDVTEVADGSESALYCETPPGDRLDLPLTVMQSGGVVTVAPSVLLSYQPCPAGTYASPTNVSCLPCPSGAYQSMTGQSACLSCPAGSVPDSALGSTSCIPCPAGSISAAGSSACSNCTSGSYTPSAGYASCLSCGVGTFSNSSAATSCAPCQPGYYSIGIGATGCTPCGAGLYADYDGALSCSPCPAGTVSAGSSCTDCPAGTFSSAQSSSCTNCLPGFYSPAPHAAQCMTCDSGSFVNVSGLSACYLCPAGQYSIAVGHVGATMCTACAAGSYLDEAGQSSCLACPLGSYAAASQSTSCSLCQAGQYSAQPSTVSCTPCDAGSFSSGNGTIVCSQCPAGSFTNSSGLSLCTLCPSGQYQDQTGQQACLACEAGTAMATQGQASCIACSSGTFSNSSGQALCLQCPAGQYSVKLPGGEGPTACEPCSAGSYSATAGQDSCQPCPMGTYAATAGSASCSSCPAGSAPLSSAGESSCSNCSAGWFSPVDGSLECTACSAGQYSDSSASTVCTPCPAGFASSSTGATGCVACDNGYFAADAGQSVCHACQAGQYGPDSGGQGLTSCLACPAGSSLSAALGTSCTVCDAGSAQAAAGQLSCVACAAGFYQPSTNETSCIPCDAGSAATSSSSTSCLGCAAGSFASAIGAAACSLCPAGTVSAWANATTCTSCSPGFFSGSAGMSACSACSAGQYTATAATAQCSSCPTGTFTATAGSVSCLSCPSGSYQSQQGMSGCMLCPNGTYTASRGNAACLTCAAASIPFLTDVNNNSVTNANGSTGCLLCAPGTFLASGGAASCLNCPTGSYAPSSGLSSCLACSPGSYNPTEGQQTPSACLSCPAGSFQLSYGSASCVPCPSGSYATVSGQAQCSLCSLGTASNATGSTVSCPSCPEGSYASSTGQSSCVPCMEGFHQPAVGAQISIPCAVGSFASTASSTNCSQCPAGTYQPQQGASDCLDCPLGFVSVSEGSSACAPCPAGSFADATGLTACYACDVGSAQPSSGQSSCGLCSAGQMQPDMGQTSCVLCAVGAFAAEGSTSCTACAIGSYQAATGSSECLDCPLGSVTAVEGSQSCVPCDPGFYSDVAASVSCLPCPAGSYQTQVGASSCTACLPGSYQLNMNASFCQLCDIGSFSNTTAATVCWSCLAGLVQPLQGASSCSACVVGTYTVDDGDGLLTCAQCAAGTYQTEGTATACLSCSQGWYSNTTGSSVCVQCIVGSYQAASGQTACDPCPAGTFTNGSGSLHCLDCSSVSGLLPAACQSLSSSSTGGDVASSSSVWSSSTVVAPDTVYVTVINTTTTGWQPLNTSFPGYSYSSCATDNVKNASTMVNPTLYSIAGCSGNSDICSAVWQNAGGQPGNWANRTMQAQFTSRSEAGAAVLSNGNLLLFGGQLAVNTTAGNASASIMLNDCWISLNAGRDWLQSTSAAAWAPRSRMMTAVIPQSDIVIILGGILADAEQQAQSNQLWLSSDGLGYSWQQQTAVSEADESPFPPGYGLAQGGMVALSTAALVVTGGSNVSDVGSDDVFVSTTFGRSWTLVCASAPFCARYAHSVAVDSDDWTYLVGGVQQCADSVNDAVETVLDAWLSSDVGSSWVELVSQVSPAYVQSPCLAIKYTVITSSLVVKEMIVYSGTQPQGSSGQTLFLGQMEGSFDVNYAAVVIASTGSGNSTSSASSFPIKSVAVLVPLAVVALSAYCYMGKRWPDSRPGVLITMASSIASAVSAATFVQSGYRQSESMQWYSGVTAISWCVTGLLNLCVCCWVFWRQFTRADFRLWFQADEKHKKTVVAVCIALALLDVDNLELLGSGLFAWAAFCAPMREHDVRVTQASGILTNLLRNVPSLVVQVLYVQAQGGWTDEAAASILAGVVSIFRSLLERCLLCCFLLRSDEALAANGGLTSRGVKPSKRQQIVNKVATMMINPRVKSASASPIVAIAKVRMDQAACEAAAAAAIIAAKEDKDRQASQKSADNPTAAAAPADKEDALERAVQPAVSWSHPAATSAAQTLSPEAVVVADAAAAPGGEGGEAVENDDTLGDDDGEDAADPSVLEHSNISIAFASSKRTKLGSPNSAHGSGAGGSGGGHGSLPIAPAPPALPPLRHNSRHSSARSLSRSLLDVPSTAADGHEESTSTRGGRCTGSGLRSRSRILSQQLEVLPGSVAEEDEPEDEPPMEEATVSPTQRQPDGDSGDEQAVPPLASLVVPLTATAKQQQKEPQGQ